MDKIFSWLAWIMPRRLVYHAAIRVFSFASTRGKLAHKEMGAITVIEALETWTKQA